ncbi:hypothetical protein POM88_014023 [Heracleum sosnowskyi]|uniref:Uncharacterized protein n=1 Tax=Heracleum sosnowskyi TaxID=360622 RepID=A0AAD8N3U4_9APIA|nr:hypothetical protein POM88_014023 [Heracleum sosnowskyi]
MSAIWGTKFRNYDMHLTEAAEEVAERVLSQPSLSGLQGPTESPVFCKRDGKTTAEYYAIVIRVPKKLLYKSVQQPRAFVPVLLLCANLYCGGTLMDQVMNLQFSYWHIFRRLNFMPSFLAGLPKDCAICTSTTDSTAAFLVTCATQTGKSVRYLSK